MFQTRMREMPSSTPETVCQRTFGASPSAARTARSSRISSASTVHATMGMPPPRPSVAPSASARRTRPPNSSGASRSRFVTATPS